MQNHPLFGGTAEKAARLAARRPRGPHPFVVGQASYNRFLDVMTECMQMTLARRPAEPQ